MEILRQITVSKDCMTAIQTFHQSEDREERTNKIVSVLGIGTALTSFIVDKGHENGNETHTILSNGVIAIQNENTQKLVTLLIGRPAQIKRYWIGLNKEFPMKYNNVIEKAKENQRLGRNNW